jgi:hypothetical protein
MNGGDAMQGIRVQHDAWQRSLLFLAALVATVIVTATTLVLVRHYAGGGSSASVPTQGTVLRGSNGDSSSGYVSTTVRPAIVAPRTGAQPPHQQ